MQIKRLIPVIAATLLFVYAARMPLSHADQTRLTNHLVNLKAFRETELGYPCAFDLDYQPLKAFLEFSQNNIGDPFASGSYRLNSHEFEREVLEFFAELTHAPKNEWWGYVTNGGTEGNLYGMYLAREMLPEGIVYFSQDSHYSVTKNLHFLGMKNIMIKSMDNGEMDYEDLRETLKIRRDVPPIIFANIGTTMKEGRDDIRVIQEIMDDLAIEKRYIHSDAALCGGYAAFLEPRPAWDFSDGTDSIAISGHKFFASPIPCGIVLARKSYVDRVGHSVAYIGTRDTTISGSRDGFSPLLLWYAIKSLGRQGMQDRLNKAMAMADYAQRVFTDAGIEAHRNRTALTVVFPRPSTWVCEKWQLASSGGISHLICMPHVRKTQIDSLLADILESSEPDEAEQGS